MDYVYPFVFIALGAMFVVVIAIGAVILILTLRRQAERRGFDVKPAEEAGE